MTHARYHTGIGSSYLDDPNSHWLRPTYGVIFVNTCDEILARELGYYVHGISLIIHVNFIINSDVGSLYTHMYI